MLICPSCGHENRDGSKFCEECATRLEPTPSLLAEERKTVTVLFCDPPTCPALWTGTTTTNQTIESSPAVAGGVVYVGSDDQKVYAFGLP